MVKTIKETKVTVPSLKQFSPYKLLNHWQLITDIAEGRKTCPVTLEIDPSNVCNHDCVWCTYGVWRKGNEVMPKKILLNLIKEARELDIKAVVFNGGGEPLVNKHLVDALYEAHNRSLEVALITNGGLFNKRICKAAVETCTYVRFSLDAASKRTHQELHRPKNPKKDNLDSILNNIKYLLKLRKEKKCDVEIGIAFLVSPANYKEIYEATKIAKKIGVDYIQIRPVYVEGKQFLESTIFEIEKIIKKSFRLVDKNFKVFAMTFRFYEALNKNRSYSRCLAHCLQAVVGADGKIYLCCQLKLNPQFCFGDLRKNTLAEIWDSRKRQEVIDKVDIDKCPICKNNRYNEVIDYLSDGKRVHKNFL